MVNNKFFFIIDRSENYYKQFIYMFPEVKNQGFIDLTLQPTKLKNKILVCMRNSVKAVIQLTNWGFEHGKDYVLADEFITSLNFPLADKIGNRLLICWGSGENMIFDDIFKEHGKFKIRCFVDKHPADSVKKRVNMKGWDYPCAHFNEIEFRKDKDFVLIQSSRYMQAKEVLESNNFVEGVDFIKDIFCILPSKMLKETITETQVYENIYCDKPFVGCNIFCDGSMRTCCPEWQSIAYGNILEESLDNIWNSAIAKIYRLSMINHTFSFCTKNLCPNLMKPETETKESSIFTVVEALGVPELLVSIDHICNLNCPQCRERKMLKNDSITQKYQEIMISRIYESGWLDKTKKLTIGGDGETFFSPIYKSILFDANSYIVKKRKEMK